MENLGILIKTLLSAPSDAEINKVKETLQSKLNNVKINTSSSGVKIVDPIKEQESIKKVEQALLNFQRNANLRISNITDSSFGKFASNSSLNNLKEQINGLTATTPDLKNKFQDINFEIRKISSEAQNAANNSLKLGDSFKTAGVKMLEWTVVKFATYYRNIIEIIPEKIWKAEMLIRPEGYTKYIQGQRIESEKI